MNHEFKYLEKVTIKTTDHDFKEISDKIGTVIGLPDPLDKEKKYIIYFTQTDDVCWTVPADYLVSTGQFENEKNIYPRPEN